MVRYLSNSTLAEFKIEWNRKKSKAGREEIGNLGVLEFKGAGYGGSQGSEKEGRDGERL